MAKSENRILNRDSEIRSVSPMDVKVKGKVVPVLN
jgi:hypothetical protein